MSSGYYIYHRVCRKILRSAHTVYVFMSFICLSEQTAIIFIYSDNWLNFMNDMECVYCAARAGYLNMISVNLQIFFFHGTAAQRGPWPPHS